MKKIIILFFLIFTLFIVSCKKEGTTVINKVENYNVDIEDLQKISDLEDVICFASQKAQASNVCVKSSNVNAIIKGPTCGSGVVVKKVENTYYIVTNYHVVGSNGRINEHIEIALNGGKIAIGAEIVDFSTEKDLALLKITSKVELTPCDICKSEVKLGEFVISAGCPYDADKYYDTITIGNVGFTDRIIKEKNLDGSDKEVENHYIQHNADINTGSSGGGLYNLKGELIGINTAKINSAFETITGLCFAIKVSDVINLFDILNE